MINSAFSPKQIDSNPTEPPGGKDRIQSDTGARDRLAAVLDLHVLPALPDTRAVWTTPFFATGARLPTAARGAALEVVGSGDGGIVVKGPGGKTATVTKKDVYACKGFVNVLDSYLVPS
jgi:hypothetical protein